MLAELRSSREEYLFTTVPLLIELNDARVCACLHSAQIALLWLLSVAARCRCIDDLFLVVRTVPNEVGKSNSKSVLTDIRIGIVRTPAACRISDQMGILILDRRWAMTCIQFETDMCVIGLLHVTAIGMLNASKSLRLTRIPQA
jgi:hypothetical protein